MTFVLRTHNCLGSPPHAVSSRLLVFLMLDVHHQGLVLPRQVRHNTANEEVSLLIVIVYARTDTSGTEREPRPQGSPR